MKETHKEVVSLLEQIEDAGLFTFACRRILDTNCTSLIDSCADAMQSGADLVGDEERALALAKDIRIVDDLVQLSVEIMVEELTRKIEEQMAALEPEPEPAPTLRLIEGGLADEDTENEE